MAAYIALLRGINVSGQKAVRMADLKEAFASLGYKDIQTYIQSGNVVFRGTGTPYALEKAIAGAMRSSFGFDVAVLIRKAADMARILANNPYGEDRASRTYFAFLDRPPAAAAVERLLSMSFAPEEIRVRGSVAYLYSPLGAGKAKLNNNYLETKLKVRATSRNLRTVRRLVEMVRATG